MFYDNPEITPANVMGDFRFSKSDERVARFASKEAEVRSLIEGQFMARGSTRRPWDLSSVKAKTKVSSEFFYRNKIYSLKTEKGDTKGRNTIDIVIRKKSSGKIFFQIFIISFVMSWIGLPIFPQQKKCNF